MSDDRSILQRMEEQGVAPPRVSLRGARRSPSASDRYAIVGEIARGGVGSVHHGRDNDLGRAVALKVLHDRHLENAELVQRFVEEAQIGGQLQHPGIVPVYELGLQSGGRPFFAMKLVKGRTLAALLAERADPGEGRRRLLRVFREVCRTVSYAHSRGVIHRDLKPSNVMIGNFGEVQVVDWGFAKVVKHGGVADETLQDRAERSQTLISTVRSGEGSSASLAGSVMGTPAYMPPEQALGRVDDLTARSDVFSLGAILCELLTGRPPYEGNDTDRLTAAAQARLGPALERLETCGADARLVALCTRCMAPLPKDRPVNATFVADEVAAYLTSAQRRAHRSRLRAIQAAGEAERQRRGRRQALLVGGAFGLALLVGLGAYLWIASAAAQREDERRGAVASALREAERLLGSRAWSQALAAVGRAEELGGETKELAARIRQGVAQEARVTEDERLLDELEELRGRFQERRREPVAVGEGEGIDADPLRDATTGIDSSVHVDAAYAALIADRFGSLASAVERLRGSHRAFEFAANLGFWAWLRRTQPPLKGRDWETLDHAARAIDPQHADVRSALLSEDPDRLADLAARRGREMPLALASEVGLALLSRRGAFAARTFLDEQFERAPQDFWINLRLAQVAAVLQDHEGAVQHASAAVALRPRHEAARLLLAENLTRAGRPVQAIALLEGILERDGENLRAQCALGLAHESHGDAEAAVACLGRAIEQDATDTAPRVLLAEILGRQGRHEDALRTFREAVARSPESPDPSLRLGRYLAQRGDFAAAVAALRKATQLAPESGWGYDLLGLALRGARELESAVSAHRQAVALNPLSAGAHSNLGIVLREASQLEEAKAVLERALELNPRKALTYNNLANVVFDMGDPEGSIALLRKAVALDPDTALFPANLGVGLRTLGRRQEALGAFRRALALDPDYARALRGAGIVLAESKRHAEAVPLLRRYIELQPDEPGSYAYLGAMLCDDLRRYDEAIAVLRRGIAVAPRVADLHQMLAVSLRGKGDHDGALAALRKAIELDPKNGSNHRQLARWLKERADTAGAVAALRRAVEVEPQRVDTYVELGLRLFSLGESDAALAALRKALELDPTWHRARVNYARLLRDTLQREAAEKEFLRAIRDRPDSAWAYLNYGILLRTMGRPEEALAAIRTCLELQPGHAEALRNARRLERLLALAPQIARIRSGEDVDLDAYEAKTAAWALYRERRHALAAKMFAHAFEREPALAEDPVGGHRYQAACAAALAGATWRARALAWLRDDLRMHMRRVKHEAPAVARMLSWWKRDPDLVSVRDGPDLPSGAPELWQEVDALLALAESADGK